jgi:PAS domain S-box-containing protein
VLVAVVALPLLGLAAWGIWTAQDAIRARAEQALLERALRITLTVERQFDRADALLRALAASASLARGDLLAMDAEMRAASAALGGLPVTLIGTDGTILLSTLWPPGERRSGMPAPDQALRVIASGETQMTDLFVAPIGGALTVSVGMPIAAAASGAPAVASGIGISFPRERIGAALREAAGLGEDGAAVGWTASIIDRSGVSVARTAGEAGVVGRRARPETLARLATREEGLLTNTTTRDGVPVISAFVRGPRSGYTFIMTMPLAEFAAPLQAALLRTLAAGALVLLFGFGLAALLARRTVRAFRAVRQAAAAPGPAPRTGLREADELSLALGEAAGERNLAEAALAASERRNREVLESLGERLYSVDSAGRLRFASRAALQGWGVEGEAVLGRRFTECFPAVEGSVGWQAAMGALDARQEMHLCAVSPLLGRWIEIDAFPSADGGLTITFRDIEDLRRAHRERGRAVVALRASEERARMALEAAEMGAWEVDLRAGTVRRSGRTLEIFGFGPDAEVEPYPSWRGRIHPEDREAALGPIRAATEGRIDSYRVEYRFQRPDGRWIWVESHGRVVARDAGGAALRLAGASRDVTERRMAADRQVLLMRELDHRAKNALAVVQAAVRLTSKADPQGFATAIEGRVAALARAHALLAEGRWSGAPLRALVEAELTAFLHPAGRRMTGHDAPPTVVLDGPEVTVAPGAAQSLSMTVHELATNATKHGALSVPDGRLSVTWRVEEPAMLRLRWQERGGPAPAAAPAHRGFGSRVIEATVRGQLGGLLERHWDADGLACELWLPLARLSRDTEREAERGLEAASP